MPAPSSGSRLLRSDRPVELRAWARTCKTHGHRASSSSSRSSSSRGRQPSIMSGALIERVRLSAYLMLAVVLGSVVWIMDAAWGWSPGGWLTTRYGFHDSIASLGRARRGGAFTLGVLLNLGPRIGKYDVLGRARAFRTPQHAHDADGADADLHRLLRLLRRVPLHPVDGLPGLDEHLPLADDLRRDRDGDHRSASRAASPEAGSRARATRSGRCRAGSPG